MRISPVGSVTVGDMNAIFPRQVQPTISVTDFSGYLVPGALRRAEDMHFDPHRGCAYSRPFFIPHNNRFDSGVGSVIDRDQFLTTGLPAFVWTSLSVSGAPRMQNLPCRPWGVQVIDFQCVSPSNWINQDATLIASSLDINGFWLFLTRTIHVPAGTPMRALWEVHFTVGDDVFRIHSSLGTPLRIQRQHPDGTSWTDIQTGYRPGESPSRMQGNSDPLRGEIAIEVHSLNGYLSIGISGAPLTIIRLEQEEPERARVTNLKVVASRWTHLGIHAHPIKYVATSMYRSMPQQIGFAPSDTTPPKYLIYTPTEKVILDSGDNHSVDYPSGSTITVSKVDTPEDINDILLVEAPAYYLTITNRTSGSYEGTNYSDFTACVCRVVTQIDEIVSPPTYAGRVLYIGSGEETPIKEVYVASAFDSQSLMIRRGATVVLNNWRGITDTAARWDVNGSGNISLKIEMGNTDMGSFPQFMGFAGRYYFTRPSSSMSLMTIVAHDLTQQLADVLILAPPNMDGWNHYSAMAYLAKHAGMSDSQLGFLEYVPDNPFKSVPDDDSPYFLPLGHGLHPWTPVNRGMSVLELMMQIRSCSGFLLYVDTNGMLQYHEWIPSSPGSPKRIFTEVSDVDGVGAPTEVMSMMVESSTDDVRNQVIHIGIDAYGAEWTPIVVKRQDDASIWSPPGSQPANYIGYRKPFIHMDSRFANLDFANEANLRAYKLLRIPTYSVTLQTWLQPDIQPLDVIWVQDIKSGVSATPFTVMQIQHRISSIGRNLEQTSTIVARYIVSESESVS